MFTVYVIYAKAFDKIYIGQAIRLIYGKEFSLITSWQKKVDY
ncbi:hypothetical protein AB9P05_07545 [Roseivirga sp. BDSF3-8]